MFFFSFRARAERSIACHVSGTLTNQIARLVAVVVKKSSDNAARVYVSPNAFFTSRSEKIFSLTLIL